MRRGAAGELCLQVSKGRGQLQAAHPDGGCRSNQQQPAASARRQRGAEPALALRAGLCAPGRCCGTCPGRRRPRCCAGRWHPSCTRTTTASSPRGPTRTAPSSACAPCGSRCARARARGLHASAHAPPVPLRRRHTRAAQRFCAESGLRVYVSAPQRSQAASHRWGLAARSWCLSRTRGWSRRCSARARSWTRTGGCSRPSARRAACGAA